ncbi:hypothetical protein RRG08_021989 [Elysia crispata]|uniref:Uncharacterized protein n=1 Tax=Elysia crispata TaxID=231223 RepID=A0AAE0XT41_9GAST|nr:hypothetical protein RRG08_021989 [Elysia crispata]
MPADHHDRGLANCEVDSGHAPTPHGEDTVSTHQANKTLWVADGHRALVIRDSRSDIAEDFRIFMAVSILINMLYSPRRYSLY